MLRDIWYSITRGNRLRISILLILLVLAAIPSLISLERSHDIDGFLLNLGSEMAGAAITFILLEIVIANRDKKDALQRELLPRLRQSTEHESKMEILAEMLRKGLLQAIDLNGLLLDGVNLSYAYMPEANLVDVNLNNADLQGIRLQRSTLKV